MTSTGVVITMRTLLIPDYTEFAQRVKCEKTKGWGQIIDLIWIEKHLLKIIRCKHSLLL